MKVSLFEGFMARGKENEPEVIERVITVSDIQRINKYYAKTDRTLVAKLNSEGEVKVTDPESAYEAVLDDDTLATLVDNVKKRELKMYNDFMKVVV